MATTKNETMKPNDETTLSSFLNNWFSIPRPRDREDPWMSSAWPTAAKRQKDSGSVKLLKSWSFAFSDTDSFQEDLFLERPTAAQVPV